MLVGGLDIVQLHQPSYYPLFTFVDEVVSLFAYAFGCLHYPRKLVLQEPEALSYDLEISMGSYLSEFLTVLHMLFSVYLHASGTER